MLYIIPLDLATEAEKLAYAQGAVAVSAAVRAILEGAAESSTCEVRDLLIPGAMIIEGLIELMATFRESGPVQVLGGVS